MRNLPEYRETHLVDNERIELACDYLVHEFRKIFPDLSYQQARKAVLKKAPTKDSDDETIRDFWNLFCAMSDGWRLKAIYNIVTNEVFQWSKEDVSIEFLKPQDPQGWMKDWIQQRSNKSYDFKAIISDLQQNTDLLQNGIKESSRKRHGRAEGDEDDPIIARKENNLFCVVDGSSRLKVKIENWIETWVKRGKSSDPPKVTAWLGIPKEVRNNFWIPTSSLFFLKNICRNDTEIIAERISPLAKIEYLKTR